MKQELYAIIGSTASGKTSYSIDLARKLNGEIISVDSRQIYYGMNIGTAKEAPRPFFPKTDYRQIWQEPFAIDGIPHYLIDICLPTDTYTAFDFKSQAEFLIADIWKRGKTPILAGGTGLYFNTLLFDYQPGQHSSDPAVRNQLQQRYDAGQKEQLWQELAQVDPVSAAAIHPNNSRYVIRALEYYLVTGHPKSSAAEKLVSPRYHTHFIGFDWPREQLYARINQRVDSMLEQGLLAEVQQLLTLYSKDLPAMSSLGYLELAEYIQGNISLSEATEQLKQNTRRYAKRQLTWFSKYKDVEWISRSV